MKAYNDTHPKPKNRPRTDRDRATCRRWQKEHPEYFRAAAKEWRAKNPERSLSIYLKSRYGLSAPELRKMLAEQGGACKICGRPVEYGAKDIKFRAVVDHNHATGKVRAVLCNNCNFILGHSKESLTILEAAAQYLRDHAHK